jgi:hypothetical protein
MFGNVITDGTQVAVGTYGYVVRFDLSAERMKEMIGVTLQLDGDQLSEPDSSPAETLAALFELCESVAATGFAWYAAGSTVYVYCKTATYGYTSNVRIAFEFYANAEPITATTDELIPERMPAEAKELVKAFILKKVYEMQNKQVPLAVNNTIAREKAALGV